MKKIFHFIYFTLLLSLFLFFSCKKDKEKLPPVISFKIGSSYTQNNTIIQIGHKLFFGIQARGNDAELTNFTIKKVLDNGSVTTVMDTGLYSIDIDIDKIFYQNVEDKVTWTFSVMDRNHLSSEIALVVYKDSNSTFGGIYYFPLIKLGYQNNTVYGHFLNPFTGMVYFTDSATANYSNIDILTYYIVEDNSPSPVLSSPGEMDNFSTEAQTYYPCINNWPARKYTLWDISFDNGNNTPLTVSDFDSAQNDSLLIVSYHDVWGKKKFKWAAAGKIIPFMTSTGKKGLIKVINAETSDNGFIEIALKIQQ